MGGARTTLLSALTRGQCTLGGGWTLRIRPVRLLAVVAALLVSAGGQPACALTAAGTIVYNVASADYGSGPIYSNEVAFTVLQVAGVSVAPETASTIGSEGQTVYFPAIVTNSGNGADSLQVSAVSADGWLCQICRDDNADGAHQDGETTTVTSTGLLDAGTGFSCFAAVTIPAGATGRTLVTFKAGSVFDPAVFAVATYEVSVMTIPIAADFIGTPIAGQLPLTVAFSDRSTGSPTSWSWSFGDGGASTSQNATHEYTDAGTYTVSLTAGNATSQDTTTKTNYISVSAPVPPVADFTGAPTSGTASLSVAFDDKSSGNPNSWRWNFGDAGSSTQQNPSHLYGRAGKYTVSLTVSNAGGQHTATKTDFVTVTDPPPIADFIASPTSGQKPLTVVFSDRSVGLPTSWSWDLGDGATSTSPNPVHEYVDSGSYTVSLTAENAGGQDTETKTSYISVSEPPLPPPAADFSASPTSGQAPLTVVFADVSAGLPTSWSWDFGDGATSTEQNPWHQYDAPGAYTVSLTAANEGGQDTETKADYIVVSDVPPAANFTASVTSGAPPLTVAFTDLSVGTPNSWYWEFGDGSTSTEQSPVHVYQLGGSFTVSLTVTSALGTSTVTKPDYILVEFSDASSQYWAYREIMACVQAGIVSGYPDGKFHPNWAVSRDQMVTFLARAIAGGDDFIPEGPITPSFSDVPPDHWAYDYVEYAESLDIINGYSGDLFAPTRLMDRGHLAVFLARSIVDPTGEAGLASYVPPSTPTFRDVTPDRKNAWCYKHVEYLVSRGVTSGYDDSRYGPTKTLSRDETAVFLARAFQLPM